MQTGRPPKIKRCPFGERLYRAREAKSLSQRQVSDALGVAQQTYAGWERRRVSIKPENIVKLADLLGVEVTELIGKSNNSTALPSGRLRKNFETIGKLPKSQQKKILDVVEAMLAQQDSA